jgi:UDP-N-acetylmuramoyl-tripeptide--D-alanyl-D-alanine ligase
MIQIEGYKNDKYIEWIDSHKEKVFTGIDKIYIIISVIITALFILLPLSAKENNMFLFAGIFVLIAAAILIIDISKKYESKKPLVFTPRAKRLFSISLAIVSADFIITIIVVYLITKNIFLYFPVLACILSICFYFGSYYMILANYVAVPIEKKVNMKFYNAASKKIKSMEKLTSVGITGSYGKTSTKFLTATILREKYKVLNTPESYNTPMGISKVINNELTDDYEIFVAELGATNVGDIHEVAILTNPKIGIITSIGPCHLESFKSIDNIMRTKYELIEYLPNDGVAIFNYDNEHVKKLADKTFKEKILYGIDDIEHTDIFATDINVSEKGSTFTLCINKLGSIECHTKILGKHNILNILAGAAVGSVLGLKLEEIAEGISKIESVEHRLQLIDPGTGVIVIDDAFNSNPDGAKAALDVLDSFKDYRKIIVTPGMVELGEIEEEENEKFGENIARTCDIAILIGKKRTLPIYRGIKKLNFSENNLYVADSLDDASKILAQLTKLRDVVLFENDLPDTYNEK